MKKVLLVIIFVFALFCGCENMMNTPTKRVEEFFGKYQKQDSEVLTQLDTIISSDEYMYTDDQLSNYKALIMRQYKSLTYNIKDETINGNTANVEVEIEVYDYNKVLNEASIYYSTHSDEFLDATGALDDTKYMDYKLSKLKDVNDRIKYTLNLTLTKQNDKWTLNDISDSDRQKIHGLYNI